MYQARHGNVGNQIYSCGCQGVCGSKGPFLLPLGAAATFLFIPCFAPCIERLIQHTVQGRQLAATPPDQPTLHATTAEAA